MFIKQKTQQNILRNQNIKRTLAKVSVLISSLLLWRDSKAKTTHKRKHSISDSLIDLED